jgi:hypothetical protein
LAAKRREMKDYIDLRRPFLYLAFQSGGVRVRIPFVETRKRKVSSKVSSNENSQPTNPSNPPNQPTSQKTKLRRAQGGKEQRILKQAS